MTDDFIWAAGGILTRQTPDGERIAIVHRKPYAGEWCLPTWKMCEDEPLYQTALRWVEEETGCKAKIKGYAGNIQYQVEGSQKIVIFFAMKLEEEGSFKASKEVDRLEWLSLEDALVKIKHEAQKDMIRKFATKDHVPHRGGCLFFRKFFRCMDGPRENRIQMEIDMLEVETNFQLDKCLPSNQENILVVLSAKDCLKVANMALQSGKINMAWDNIHNARRKILGCKTQEELNCEALKLKNEASKLSNWRKEAMQNLLDYGGNQNTSVVALRDAMEIRDEGYSNKYFKNDLRRQNLSIAFAIVVMILIAIPAIVQWGGVPAPFDKDKLSLLALVMLLGSLGAALSVAVTLTRRDTSVTIPDQILGSFVTWMRPAIGAAAAIASYILLHAGVLGSVTNTETNTIFLFAFISGFSERFIVNAIGETVKEK